MIWGHVNVFPVIQTFFEIPPALAYFSHHCDRLMIDYQIRPLNVPKRFSLNTLHKGGNIPPHISRHCNYSRLSTNVDLEASHTTNISTKTCCVGSLSCTCGGNTN